MTARPQVSQLNLDDLAPGERREVWLELLYDGLGKPVQAPVILMRGKKDGPVAGLTAAVHGNEVNGVLTIHRLLDNLSPDRLRGTIVAVPIVNVPAFLLHQRRTDDGHDLNHHFPGSPTGREVAVLAHRIFSRVVTRVDFLLDLHTASFGRVNSLYVRADLRESSTARMAALLNPDIIVHNPPSDGTLRGASMAHGVPAITIEIGDPARLQSDMVQRTRRGLRAILADKGMLPRRAIASAEPPVICSRSAWMFTEHGGILEVLPSLRDVVTKGQVVARIRDAFGQMVHEYVATHDGIIIGKSTDPVAQTGARILHLGRIARRSSPLHNHVHPAQEAS